MSDDIERARVPVEPGAAESTLFPLHAYSTQPRSPRDICAELGLNWLSALKLHEEGWLTFDPAKPSQLDAAQQAELRFLGKLVVAGCDGSLLTQILAGLRKPYAYRIDRLYYDWESRKWELLPSDRDMAAHFAAWLSRLVDSGEMAVLEQMRVQVTDSIRELRSLSQW